MIYWAVPKGHMPWRSVWPGALFFVDRLAGIANYVFPFYLTNVSDLNRIGATARLHPRRADLVLRAQPRRCWPAR